MRARVIVMEPDDYEAWVTQAKAEVASQPAPGAAPGRRRRGPPPRPPRRPTAPATP